MGNYFSYKRISTKEKEDKQSYNRQEKSLKSYAEKNNIEYTLELKDDISGASFNRPNWIKLEKLLQENDTVIFKDISRFTRQAEVGFDKYMELMNVKGVNLVFLDNPTVSTDYIKNLTKLANEQDLVAKTALESTIKLLLIVELDRVEKERIITVQRIKQGIAATSKKSGRRFNSVDKMTDELREDIQKFLKNRTIKHIDLINKHKISRNTLKKYIEIIQNQTES